ncbi:MAG: hypothetical protein LLG42_02875 [Chloroflexi bacterium]|nr:hypothetical protein [Chloroflexota bacterium]
MEPGVLEKICSQIYRKYPEFKGKRPRVKAYASTQNLLIFSSQGTTADGKSITRSLRVIVDENGKIGKVTTSR